MDIQRINPSEKWSDVTVFNGMAHFVEVASNENAVFVDHYNLSINHASATGY